MLRFQLNYRALTEVLDYFFFSYICNNLALLLSHMFLKQSFLTAYIAMSLL